MIIRKYIAEILNNFLSSVFSDEISFDIAIPSLHGNQKTCHLYKSLLSVLSESSWVDSIHLYLLVLINVILVFFGRSGYLVVASILDVQKVIGGGSVIYLLHGRRLW